LALGIPKAEFLSLLQREPTLTYRLYLELSQRFLGAIEAWRFQPEESPELCVARYLLALHDVRQQAAEIKMRQVELATATGLRRETVNRLLRRWSREGWVTMSPSTITLNEPKKLRAIVAAAPGKVLVRRYGALNE
jgi:CRP-like cAMP-binding protein